MKAAYFSVRIDPLSSLLTKREAIGWNTGNLAFIDAI